MTYYYEFLNDKSSKFWEASQKAKEVTVRYGKIDATGITKTFPFDTPKEAKDFLNKKRMEKEKKGYKTTKKKKPSCSSDKSLNFLGDKIECMKQADIININKMKLDNFFTIFLSEGTTLDEVLL